MKDIVAVVVLYQPDWLLLTEVLSAISLQCEKTIVIDNTPTDNSELFSEHFGWSNNLRYLPMLSNLGIASAQNRGIIEARKTGCSKIIFFDQDSVPDPELVSSLIEGYNQINASDVKIGAIGPRATSRATNIRYEGKFDSGKVVSLGITELKQLISSGSLIEISTFDEVGLFDEHLFIDLVDFEWCWRAGALFGFKHFIIEKAQLFHMFGEKESRVLGFRITIPSSFRIYYQFRNFFILLGRGYVPLYWKLSNAFKLSVKLVLFPLICKNKLTYINRSTKGIRDGINYRK